MIFNGFDAVAGGGVGGVTFEVESELAMYLGGAGPLKLIVW